jgi:N-acetylglucosamine malate deacetylase 1
MNRIRGFVWGVLAGLILAGSYGFARMTTEAPKTVEAITAAALAAETAPADDGKLRVIVFGAHPDDGELDAGGSGCLWSGSGNHVEFVSATNGDIGHWQSAGGPLAIRRTAEVQEASKVMGTTARVLDIHDGEIEPTLENRRTFTRLIRNWNADIVIGPRTNDYHPDHRYTGILVQDAAYMVTVPFFCPDTKPLKKNPVFLYSSDGFQKPNPFHPDIVVSIDSVIDKKMEALSKLVSQFIEGGCEGGPGSIPRDEADLKKRQDDLCKGWLRNRYSEIADRYRNKLIELYGPEAGKQVRFAEAFEICEYGRQPTPEELRQLFPFLPKPATR